MQRLENAQIINPALGEISPTAGTSGVSTPTGATAPVFGNHGYIANLVTFNPFQPPDLITATGPAPLAPLHLNQPWSLSVGSTSSLNYDSNITRVSGPPFQGDGYFHTGAGFDFRWGTKIDPLALDLSYDYTADLFDRYRQFDTYTHNLSFSSRIGRSSFVLVPYVVGRFRSVEDQAASDSGRQSYDFLTSGAHGENAYYPDLVHVYNLSYTSVSYPALPGADFGIWELTQQLYFKPEFPVNPKFSQKIEFFPWLDLKRTVPEGLVTVDEISGGIGMEVAFADHLSLKAQGGWGGVSSGDRTIDYDSYAGPRYDASLVYQPRRYLVLTLHAVRVLNFTPRVRSRDVDEIDGIISCPLNFGPYFSVTPAVELYYANSLDYLDPNDHSFYAKPSLTADYTFDKHFAVFGKVEYSSALSSELDSGALPAGPNSDQFRYTHDLQASVGVTLLF